MQKHNHIVQSLNVTMHASIAGHVVYSPKHRSSTHPPRTVPDTYKYRQSPFFEEVNARCKAELKLISRNPQSNPDVSYTIILTPQSTSIILVQRSATAMESGSLVGLLLRTLFPWGSLGHTVPLSFITWLPHLHPRRVLVRSQSSSLTARKQLRKHLISWYYWRRSTHTGSSESTVSIKTFARFLHQPRFRSWWLAQKSDTTCSGPGQCSDDAASVPGSRNLLSVRDYFRQRSRLWVVVVA